MEKQLTSSGCPEQAENCSFVHNPDKTSGSVTWHTPPTPSVPRDHADVPPAPVLGLLTVCCLLFIHQLVMEIFAADTSAMLTEHKCSWFPSSYLHETAFNKVGQVHLVCNFVIMVLHNLFAEFEWDCSATCEHNLAYFVIISPLDISFFSLFRDHDVTMMDSQNMWDTQTLTARERREETA